MRDVIWAEQGVRAGGRETEESGRTCAEVAAAGVGGACVLYVCPRTQQSAVWHGSTHCHKSHRAYDPGTDVAVEGRRYLKHPLQP